MDPTGPNPTPRPRRKARVPWGKRLPAATEPPAADGQQPPPRIHIIRYNRGHVEEHTAERVSQARDFVKPGWTTWINVNGIEGDAALEALRDLFGVHPLTLEDVVSAHQRPKVEEYPSYLYVVMQMIKQKPRARFELEQVSFLVGDTWLITVQEGKPGDVFGPVRESLRLGRPQIRSGGPDHLLYGLLAQVVAAGFPLLEAFGGRAEELEDRILEGASVEAREALQDLKRDLLTVRRIAWPQRDALARLERDELRLIRPETRPFLRDLHDQGVRVLDFVETNRELIASLMDLYLANTAQRTNEVMKVLTVVATIFIPLTFITSLYGMNFRYMPELEEWWGYPAVLAFMALLAGGMLLYFRRRGWL